MLQLAKRMGRAKPSAIMAVAEKAKALKAAGRDIISFSIGVPNFLPGEHVYAAAREALSKDSGQYGSNRGSDALRRSPRPARCVAPKGACRWRNVCRRCLAHARSPAASRSIS